MKKVIFTLFLIHSSLLLQAQVDYARYVNPFIGTGGHGHTFPGATLPFGMVQLSPDTRIDGSWDGCGGYHYSDSVIYGFSHTHLSGTGVSDYGDIMLMPMFGKSSLNNKQYSSKFYHKDETAVAGYYSVKLDDDQILVELTTTSRVGMHRYAFPGHGTAYVVLDLNHRDKLLQGTIRQVSNSTFEGIRRSEAWAKDQHVYYRIEFSKSVTNLSIERNGDNDEKALFEFNLEKNEKLLVKVALSSVNEEGAKKNMEAELSHWNFEKVKTQAHDAWQKELSKIEVSGGTEEQMRIFYTALYHTMIQPNIYNDVDGQYRGRDLKIHKTEGFNYYTVFSLWDTFRAWHPLMTIIDRQRTLDYIKTFLAQYEHGGLLPVWELSSNETECMIGYHSVSVIADAAAKGITDFNMEKAFEAMKKSAMTGDRFGLGAYMERGCLSLEDENESVSKTLEYAYDDFCIAQMAKQLHHEKDYQYFMERSQYWKNLFDPKTGFIRPRKNGGWYEPFDPYEVNNNYTEANAWQYTFFVPHEIKSYINLMGGQDAFEKKLDELFSADSRTSGREQSDITGLIGQYAHGNEPSHHMAYLYNYIGKPWKTQQRVRQILTEFYHDSPDGLIGNEDCGQMSAWYVMSAMGLYQDCPGEENGSFHIVPPLFPQITIHLENGKNLKINTDGNVDQDSYIEKWQLNNEPVRSQSSFIDCKLVETGGVLNYSVAKAPEHKRITAATGRTSVFPIIEVPLIEAASLFFRDSVFVSVRANHAADNLMYSITSGETPKPYQIYTGGFYCDTTVAILAYAESQNKKSKVATAHFYKMPHPDWKIHLFSTYSPQYTAGGNEALIDGIQGDVNWRKGNWQGYQTNLECIIDLGNVQEISQFSADFLQDTRAWILFPTQVEFSFSIDSVHFSNPRIVKNNTAANDYKEQIQQFSSTIPKQKVRFVKMKAINYGILPDWHAGAGGQAWIFADEISGQ